jgi:hypothetical protein
MARRDPRGLQGIEISRHLNLAAADLTFQQVQPDRHDQNCDPVQRHDGCERRVWPAVTTYAAATLALTPSRYCW